MCAIKGGLEPWVALAYVFAAQPTFSPSPEQCSVPLWHARLIAMVDKKLTEAQLSPATQSRNQSGELDMKTFLNMLRDEAGASAAEYALILAIVGSAIALAAITLGGAISTSMNTAADCISDTTTC